MALSDTALLAEDADGAPGWAGLAVAEGAGDAVAADAELQARGVAGFEELLESCAALGVRFLVCEMGLRAMDLKAAALREDLQLGEGGLVTFLTDASRDGAMLFV